MPQGLPSISQRLAAAASLSCTAAWPMSPRWPIDADRSPGPMKIASTPLTPAIASSWFSASTVSIWTTTHSSVAATLK